MDFKPTYNPYWSAINGELTQTLQGPVISILQNNCGNANYKSARPFFDRLDPDTHHIIASRNHTSVLGRKPPTAPPATTWHTD
jgi:hypothetical protein